jgi:hypothetical protein
MGDRTYVYIAVHPADVSTDGWKQWLDVMGTSEYADDGPSNEWSGGEVNYAAYSELEMLANSGVRFYGHHGSGGCYEAAEFFADGEDGVCNYSPPDLWPSHRIVVRVTEDLTEIDNHYAEEELRILRRFLKLNEELTKEKEDGTHD